MTLSFLIFDNSISLEFIRLWRPGITRTRLRIGQSRTSRMFFFCYFVVVVLKQEKEAPRKSLYSGILSF